MTERAQRDLILKHLMRCEPITPLDALKLYGCFRLGARIWELKQPQFGSHPIKTELVTVGGKKFAKYTYNFSHGESNAEAKGDVGPQFVPQPGA